MQQRRLTPEDLVVLGKVTWLTSRNAYEYEGEDVDVISYTEATTGDCRCEFVF